LTGLFDRADWVRCTEEELLDTPTRHEAGGHGIGRATGGSSDSVDVPPRASDFGLISEARREMFVDSI